MLSAQLDTIQLLMVHDHLNMPCHISDGPQTPEDIPSDYVEVDTDKIYDQARQDRIDDLNQTLRDIARHEK